MNLKVSLVWLKHRTISSSTSLPFQTLPYLCQFSVIPKLFLQVHNVQWECDPQFDAGVEDPFTFVREKRASLLYQLHGFFRYHIVKVLFGKLQFLSPQRHSFASLVYSHKENYHQI